MSSSLNNNEEPDITEALGLDHHSHLNRRWKARLVVCILMLFIAFVSLIVMDLHSKSYWFFSRIMAASYAVLSIWLFWYLNRGQHKVSRSTLWHQVLHWLGLLMAVYLISIFVNTGLIGAIQAGLVTLVLLSLTIFLAGVYSNFSFIVIGIMLAIFAGVAAVIEAYLSLIMIPVIIIAAIIVVFVANHERRRAKKHAKKA